jgi:hypothetical protein
MPPFVKTYPHLITIMLAVIVIILFGVKVLLSMLVAAFLAWLLFRLFIYGNGGGTPPVAGA